MQVKPKVLLVDDEERILRSLGLLLRMQYQVFATSDGNEALEILRREKIHVLISDQRMPIMTGSELLRQAREVAPDTVRILLTGYADADAALDAVNDGEIFRYINKPWGPKELRDTIAQAAEIALQVEGNEMAVEVPEAALPAKLVCLVLDRDESTYRAVLDILGGNHEVVWRQSVQGALQVLASKPVAILVTELSLGDEDLSAMIKTLKQEHPEMLTVVLTCFKDTSRLVDLINQAQVFRYLPKPVRKGMLTRSIESTITRYRELTLKPVLLKTQQVEKTANTVEQQSSARILDYLSRLRGKTGFGRPTVSG